MKKLFLFILVLTSLSFGQSWNTIVTTTLSEPNVDKTDLFTNKDGNHLLVKRYNGNIGTSTTKDSVTLFSTMKKYGESKAFYTTNQNTAPAISNPKEVKIRINVPVYDAKDIDDMNVVAMVKGEYQIKTIDLQNELENGKNKDDRISVPFNFNRQTEVGAIQIGDLFFGCATSDEFPNQNSDCEKKMIKDLDKVSKICARKDNSC